MKLKNSICLTFIGVLLANVSNANDIDSLSLTELFDIEVTSVSKKKEKAFESAAAIYVLTDVEIKRLGAENVAEALRFVPGIQVSRSESNGWAVSSRGFTAQFANKLLVLVDGRSIYTPLFSGVYWDVQDLMLEDVKRIEVIRGPGATLWGANAVNGIINIITKRASETQDGYYEVTYGNGSAGYSTAVRYGGKIDENTYYRTYAKHQARGNLSSLDRSDSHDDWDLSKSGFRVDNEGLHNSFTVQGDVYSGNKGNTFDLISHTPTEIIDTDGDVGGANILTKWTHMFDDGSESALQVYFDHSKRDSFVGGQAINIFDIDFHHNTSFDEKTDLIWGGAYRFAYSDAFHLTPYYSFNPARHYANTYSSFAQVSRDIIPDKFNITTGAKLEHNSYTGVEFQPSIRAAWNIDDKQVLWGAVSRSVRTPSIAEEGVNLISGLSPFPNGFLKVMGADTIRSEVSVSHEIGYRIKPRHNMKIETAFFMNDYRHLRSIFSTLDNVPDVDLHLNNEGEGRTYGFEVNGDWDVSKDWNLKASYSYVKVKLDTDAASGLEEGITPRNMFNIHSSYDFADNWQLDNVIYYVDNLSSVGIKGYTRVDARVAWKPLDNMEVSLVAQNLLDNRHQEFTTSYNISAKEVGRTIFAKVGFEF